MAENILGLLLVTSSSRGRHVFRYPPDPASPNIRLAQPIYPSATFTAADADIEYKLPRGSGSGVGGVARRRWYGGGEDRSSNASIRRSLFGGTGGSSSKNRNTLGNDNHKGKKKAKRDDLYARYMNPEAEGAVGGRGSRSDYGEDSDDLIEVGSSGSGSSSSSDEDSDEEFLWSAGNGPHNFGINTANPTTGNRKESRTVSHTHNHEEKERRDSNSNTNSALRSLEASTIMADPSRRGSASTTTATVTGNEFLPSSSALDTGEGGAGTSKKQLESQYNYALGWPLETLSDMLTPPRAACHRKFELCVGNIVFLGHPVCSGPDGKWEVPLEEEEEDLEDRAPSRGRRMRESAAQSTLDTVVEGREAQHGRASASRNRAGPISNSKSSQRNLNVQSSQTNGNGTNDNGSSDDAPPSLNMFHLVLIIDKPDPKAGMESHDEHHSQTLGMYDEIYREIAFKWTAAAFKLQCETNFIAKETWTMVKYKERCLAEGINITDCCRWINAHCALDRTLNTLYLRLHQLRVKPINALHSYLPTTLTTTLGDMTVQTVLSPAAVNADEAWAHWGEMDEASDSETSESDGDEWEDPAIGGGRKHEIKVHPWQTLLLVDEDATQRANEISLAVIGLGIGADDSGGGGERRGSKATIATTTAEEDETILMKTLIEACDVTRPLVEIAHALRYDLDGIIIPLARELVQNKRAILIDVINTRLRTVVMPTTIDEHTVSIDQYSARFTRTFPTLPSFPKFISSISSSPIPFRDIIPADPDLSTRRTYLAALIWLLKQDLVVQVHTRARIFARKEVKVEAWKRLWKRRRERWLHVQKEKENMEMMRSPTGSDMITPKAVTGIVANPLDTSTMGTVPSPKVNTTRLEPSYMSYDPALEMDSDEEFDTDIVTRITDPSTFSVDVDQPLKSDIPKFESSFIFKPSRAQKDESRWLRVIREAADEVWASKFDLCVQYLDGFTTFEEISYRTGLPRRELEKILHLYKEDIVTFLHP
ncbi:hypothetical protein CI109_105709 [Kwoniella shandongensis]|uniref:Nitrogen permease regulator 3 n=1 Tax=Kwoniella shandongensis TaxID=1734106 RepID=A0AAJ8LQ47_9TREE